jgi:methylated-DNA-[protein]-cysteine S-methyltransferase
VSAAAATHVTPVGAFTIVADPDGAVLASGWTADPWRLSDLVAPSLRPRELRPRAEVGEASRALRRYLAGDLAATDAVRVRQRGAPFLEAAWAALRAVPAGAPVSYAELAALSGRPAAVRAAASACARNAAALFVPCHRVVRSDGSLGGFGWGLPVKRWLLGHEAG